MNNSVAMRISAFFLFGMPLSKHSGLPRDGFVRRLNEALMNREMESLASRTPFAALQPRLRSE